MTYLEMVGLILTGAGTMASILGIFFAVYAKQNGRVTREAIAEASRQTLEVLQHIEHNQVEARKEVAEILQTVRNQTDQTLREIARLIVAEGEKTRQAITSS
jgi:hypothetical protein